MRHNYDANAPACLVPNAVAVGGYHGEGIFAGRHIVVIRDAARAGVHPIAIDPRELVSVFDLLRPDETETPVLNIKTLLIGLDIDGFVERDGHARDSQLFNHNRRRCRVFGYFSWVN